MQGQTPNLAPLQEIDILDNYKIQMLRKLTPEEFRDQETDVEMRPELTRPMQDNTMNFLAAEDLLQEEMIHKR